AATGSAAPVASRTYLCEDNGAGACKSLLPHAAIFNDEDTWPVNQDSAWTWEAVPVGTVNPGTFTYGPLENATAGDTVLALKLFDDQSYCDGNKAGTDVIKQG